MTYMNIAEGFSYVDDEYLCLVEQVKKQRRTWRVALKRVAMFFLALLVGASVWLAADEGARAAFQRWVREVYENSVVYRFFGSPEDAFPQYELTWIPEGCALEKEIDGVGSEGNQKILIYKNPETDEGFVFVYQATLDDVQLIVDGYENENMRTSELCNINEIEGHYYPANDLHSSCLIWIDNYQGVAFYIDSTMDKDTVLHIAEGVVRIGTAE